MILAASCKNTANTPAHNEPFTGSYRLMNLTMSRPSRRHSSGGNRKPVEFIIVPETRNRLMKRHFRKDRRNVAGNFMYWPNPNTVIRDPRVRKHFTDDVLEAVRLRSKRNSVCIDLERPLGWESTDDLANYDEKDLELFEPNNKSIAFRVRTDRVDLLAPQTYCLTIVYEIRVDQSRIAVIVHSMYPGEDVGELRDNISEREKCVFFDWDHPGQVS